MVHSKISASMGGYADRFVVLVCSIGEEGYFVDCLLQSKRVQRVHCLTGGGGQDGAKSGKLLQLAESMAAKQLEGASADREPAGAVMLYCDILQVCDFSQACLERARHALEGGGGFSFVHVHHAGKGSCRTGILTAL
jgi:hypothetical protein